MTSDQRARIKKIVELFDTGMVQPSPKFWEVVHSIGVRLTNSILYIVGRLEVVTENKRSTT